MTKLNQTLCLVEKLSAPPDIQPTLEIWQATLDWVRTDPDGILRRTIFRKRSAINGRVLILRRLPPEMPWSTIAADFNLTSAEAKDLLKFYHRKCLPLLRKFSLSQGFMEELGTGHRPSRQNKTPSLPMRKAS